MKICTGSLRFNETNYELMSLPNSWFAYEPVELARHTGGIGSLPSSVFIGAFLCQDGLSI